MQLFDWKWVNRLDSVRGSSFFSQIPSFWPPTWHFFQNFRFGGRFFFFFAAEFSLRQISANFRLEIGQWEGLPRRIIVFQRNSNVLVSEMAFFENFVSVLIFFCVKIQFRLNWCKFSIGNRSMGRNPLEIHRLSAKFYRFGLRNVIF